MAQYRKVVWNEGMLLGPHHFQQWDNYFEHLLASRVASLSPYEWGVLDIEVNREAVKNGFFELESYSAVLPDGMYVSIPHADPAPPARAITGHFDPVTGHAEVFLAIPARRAGAPNFQTNGAGTADQVVRYVQVPGEVIDETGGPTRMEIAFARGNYRILFGDEPQDGYSVSKIAEVERTVTGQFALSETYIPPSIGITASPWLYNLLSQIVEILVAKNSALAETRRQRTTSLADFTTSEVAAFWLLHTVNSALPVLAHMYRTRRVHPEQLYVEMARLVGELMTFAVDRHPKDIVAYDHLNLWFTFSSLASELRDLLETVIPTRCVAIPLDKTRESLYLGRIVDDRLLGDAAFFLGVKAQMPEGRMIDRVPNVVKITSHDSIDTLVRQALPGVSVMHASPPPAPIPTRVGYHYFSLDKVGPHWEKILGSRTVSIYVPDEFPDVKLELYAVKP